MAITARQPALSHGLLLIVMPMHPLMDQPAIGRAIAKQGAGRLLAKSGTPGTISRRRDRSGT